MVMEKPPLSPFSSPQIICFSRERERKGEGKWGERGQNRAQWFLTKERLKKIKMVPFCSYLHIIVLIYLIFLIKESSVRFDVNRWFVFIEDLMDEKEGEVWNSGGLDIKPGVPSGGIFEYDTFFSWWNWINKFFAYGRHGLE